MHIQYATRSKIGTRRSNNEDCCRIEIGDLRNVSSVDNRMLFAVADGMGGHPCGEVASMMACGALAGFFEAQGKVSGKKLQKTLEQSFFDIDEQIKQYTRKNPACLHMGTTLSVMIIFGEQAVISHVGDTRIYCLRDEKLKLLTTDHTFVQEMMEKGALTAKMGETSPYRNVLTRVIGTEEPLEGVSSQLLDIITGDRFLLSSDGLHDSVSFQDIELMMGDGDDPEKTAKGLMSCAIANGGRDDITLIIVHTA